MGSRRIALTLVPVAVVTALTDRAGRGTDGGRIHRDRTFVADAAGTDTVDEVAADGSVRVVAYIPHETAAAFRDATPTCIAHGPDGMLHVGTLDLVAGPARAEAWNVDPDGAFPTAPSVWATGLTSVSSCTMSHDGTFWATEMFAPTGDSTPPDDVVRIEFRHPSSETRFGAGELPLPGGIGLARDGEVYVAVNSADPTPGSGQVVRLNVAR